MRVGLIDVDGHGTRKKHGAMVYPNLALCKISAWYKAQGHEVFWYEPMYSGHCEKVYVSKVFNFSPDIDFFIDADEVIKGGTGYDIRSQLPQEIDMMQPDYSIYPHVPKNVAYGFLTRGCPNKCKWCVVPIKEGSVRPYMDVDDIATPERKNLILMDNNILAVGNYAKEQLRKIIDRDYKIDFNQALDARLVTEEFASLLAQIKWIDSRIRFGCDTPTQIKECERAIKMITDFGYKGQFFLYTMLNDNFEECFKRINYWWKRNQELITQHHRARIYPYAQPYRDPHDPTKSIPQWQKDMAHWVNKKQIFENVSFAEFSPRKNFKCNHYIKQIKL